MHYVYVLQSEKTQEIYIGYTSDLRKRFSDHNAGRSLATKSACPWKLMYYEAYINSKLAYHREKNLKHYGKSLAMLKKRIGITT